MSPVSSAAIAFRHFDESAGVVPGAHIILEASILRRTYVVAATLIGVVAVIVLIERQAYMPTARFFETWLVAAFIAVSAWAAGARWRNVLVMLCSLVIGVAALEGVALAMGVAPGPIADDGGNGKGRPLVGWGSVRPGVFHSTKVDVDGRSIFDTHVTIDEHLNRKTVPSDGPHPIAFFGDSWIYGDGLNDTDTLPQTFADLNMGRIPVLNLAFGGWSPAQNLIALQTGLYQDLLKQPRHFFLFTATFHVIRTSCKVSYTASAPRFVIEGDALRYTGKCSGAATAIVMPLVRVVRRFALYERIAPLFAKQTRRDVETYIKIIETFVATAKQRYGVKTTVLFPPFGDRYIKEAGYGEDEILATLRKAGIDVLPITLPRTDRPELYTLPVDGHPTALANHLYADQIETHLREVDPTALQPEADEPARP